MTEAGARGATVRDATLADLEVLAEGNRAMALETEDKALDPAVLRRGVRGLLEQPARGFYLVAERAGAFVGQAMVTYEWSDWRDGTFFWIQSVYVPPEARRRGVFRALYAEIERRAAAEGACGLRLYVERENERAQATYRALGMRETAYRLFEVER